MSRKETVPLSEEAKPRLIIRRAGSKGEHVDTGVEISFGIGIRKSLGMVQPALEFRRLLRKIRKAELVEEIDDWRFVD